MLRKGHGGLYNASTMEEERKKRKAKRRERSDQINYMIYSHVANGRKTCPSDTRQTKVTASLECTSCLACICSLTLVLQIVQLVTTDVAALK